MNLLFITGVWNFIALGAGAIAFIFVISVIRWVLSLRVVVPNSKAHIVRRNKRTVIYGDLSQIENTQPWEDLYEDDDNVNESDGPDKEKAKVSEPSSKPALTSEGNIYYKFPEWVPGLGVSVTIMDLSIFQIPIEAYEAYDKDRLPFVVDLMAFFRVDNCVVAATRASNVESLKDQLEGVIQGAARTILAKEDLEGSIMGERAKYGRKFTKEVANNLASWGVAPVKSIELMDIRDAKGQTVIADIMNKKISSINKISRQEVAVNNQEAEEAEIASRRQVDLKKQEAREQVGMREAEVTKKTGIAQQQSEQAVQEETKNTKEKEMAVIRVGTIQQAEINKDAKIINAKADQEKMVIDAGATKEKTVIDAQAEKEKIELDAVARLTQTTKDAEGNLIKMTKNAAGIKAEGEANAEAKRLMEMAIVTPQLEKAKEIGNNQGYQDYLVKTQYVDMLGEVGKEQAKNLGHANIKIVTMADNAAEGVNQAAGMLSPKGGLNLGGMLEGLVATDMGQALVGKVLGSDKKAESTDVFEPVEGKKKDEKKPEKNK